MKVMGLEVSIKPSSKNTQHLKTLMRCQADFADALNFTAHIDFSRSHTSDGVSLFETTIRFLGGMLSAYELGGKKDEALIKQAIALGDKLAFAWVGDNTCTFDVRLLFFRTRLNDHGTFCKCHITR